MGYSDWPHLAQVCRLERTVTTPGRTRRELAYAVTSLSPQEAIPERLLHLWRDTGASRTGSTGCGM